MFRVLFKKICLRFLTRPKIKAELVPLSRWRQSNVDSMLLALIIINAIVSKRNMKSVRTALIEVKNV